MQCLHNGTAGSSSGRCKDTAAEQSTQLSFVTCSLFPNLCVHKAEALILFLLKTLKVSKSCKKRLWGRALPRHNVFFKQMY